MGMLEKESLHKKKAFSKSKNHLTASKVIVLEWIVKGPSKTYKFILTEDYVTISSDHRFFKMSIAKIMSLTEVEFCSSYLWWTGNALKGSGWLIWIACLFDHSLLRSWNCVAGVVVKNEKNVYGQTLSLPQSEWRGATWRPICIILLHRPRPSR